jgi:outer membrane receptor protein involved in Fe transport
MQAAGVSCLEVGRTFRDVGNLRTNDGTDYVLRGVAGVKGELEGGWSYNAYYQFGRSKTRQSRIDNLLLPQFALAVDAVRAPDGQIVCRSTLTDPGNGCVPLNVLGEGSVSDAAAEYILGTSLFETIVDQHVVAATVSGRPFDTWAGPVGLAVGGEYRKDTLEGIADPLSIADAFQTGNRKSTAGEVTVKEVFAEVEVPLLTDLSFAESVDINGAVRYADYSSSGGVTTWKVGGSWEIPGGLRFRATRSRDIRAGNIGELFTPEATTLRNVRHPLSGIQGPATTITTGNRTLGPEKADTWTAGVQYRPDWLAGVRLSVDYFDITIDDVIGSIGEQTVVDGCVLDNNPQLCNLVTITGTGAGAQVTRVLLQQLNLNRFETAGVDFEAVWNTDLGDGDLGLRLLATYIDKLATTAEGRTTDQAGEYTDPHWRVFGTVSYGIGNLSGLVDMRWYGGGNIDNTLTEGSGAPQTVNFNEVDPTFYTNLTLTLAFDETKKRELFVRVNNLFDQAPPYPDAALYNLFDPVGRSYRIGVRYTF